MSKVKYFYFKPKVKCILVKGVPTRASNNGMVSKFVKGKEVAWVTINGNKIHARSSSIPNSSANPYKGILIPNEIGNLLLSRDKVTAEMGIELLIKYIKIT